MLNCKFFKEGICQHQGRMFETCDPLDCKFLEKKETTPNREKNRMSECRFFKNNVCIIAGVKCEGFIKEDCSLFESDQLDCLKEASDIINGARQDAYGAPEDSFSLIAQYWSAYLDRMDGGPLSSVDVGNLLMLFKVARCSGQKPSRDNYIDIAGYAAITADRLLETKEVEG